MHSLLMHLRSSLPMMEPQGLVLVLWACVRLGTRPAPSWMSLYVQVSGWGPVQAGP